MSLSPLAREWPTRCQARDEGGPPILLRLGSMAEDRISPNGDAGNGDGKFDWIILLLLRSDDRRLLRNDRIWNHPLDGRPSKEKGKEELEVSERERLLCAIVIR